MDQEKPQCVMCHKLRLKPNSKPHSFERCPERDFYINDTDKCSWCNFCSEYTRYYTELDHACIGQCAKQPKHQDLTIDLKLKNNGIIRTAPNKYMVKGRKFGNYNSHKKSKQ